MIYRTSLDDTVLSPVGCFRLPSGVIASMLPALDTRHEIFARHDYADADAFARKHNGRLGTASEHTEIATVGLYVTPVTLWPCEMMDLDTYKIHDKLFWMRVGMAGWQSDKPIVNAGKQWLGGAAKGRAINFGWFVKTKGTVGAYSQIIQTPGHQHDASHYDYSQTTTVFWDSVDDLYDYQEVKNVAA